MQVYRSFDEVPHEPNTVLTLGTFDGVHRGHRALLSRLFEVAKEKNSRALVITFEPHPQIVLQKPGREPVQLLTTISERLQLFEDFGVEHVLVIPFSYEFSRTAPDVFVKNFLFEKIGLRKMIIGHDHMFGRDREGSERIVRELSIELGFEFEKMTALSIGEEIISSTKIRHALKNGEIERANSMLGYDYFAEGTVIDGDKRGRTIGIPTANFSFENKHKLLPKNGIYCVSSEIDGRKFFGMANLGTRPTFTDDTEPTLEVHYFDLEENLYGKKFSVAFHKYIREEKKFSGVEELLAWIERDRIACHQYMSDSKISS